jgi:hypothetical protein
MFPYSRDKFLRVTDTLEASPNKLDTLAVLTGFEAEAARVLLSGQMHEYAVETAVRLSNS